MTDVQLKEPILRLTRLQPLPCQSCPKVFYSSTGLGAHHRATHAAAKVDLPEPCSKAHTCGFCGKSFTTRRWMNFHVAVKHMGSKANRPRRQPPLKAETKSHFICKFCGYSFTTRRWMSYHVKRHLEDSTHVEGPHKCTHCKYGAPSWPSLWRHVKRSHRNGIGSQFVPSKRYSTKVIQCGGQTWECAVCKKRFPLRATLAQHMVTHDGAKPFRCSPCRMDFSGPEDLQAHTASHTQDQLKPFKCSSCAKRFSLKIYLDVHMGIHDGSHKPCQCSTCGKRLGTRQQLRDHVVTHGEVREFVSTADTITTHKLSQSGEHFECLSCGRRLANEEDLRAHAKHIDHTFIKREARSTEDGPPFSSQGLKVHVGLMSVDCSTCGKVFSGQDHLDAHMLTHSRQLSCSDCGRKFTCSRNLMSHQMAAHRSKKRFGCSTCGKQLATKFSLDRHITGVHSEVKPWDCSTCGQEFTAQHLLDGHNMINHNEEKPFECSTCGQGFNSKPNLWEHALTHSEDEALGTSKMSIDVKPGMCHDVRPEMSPDDVNPEMCSENVNLVPLSALKCSPCGEMCASKSALKAKHIKATHSGQAAFVCSICGKELATKSSLDRHITRAHSEVKPWECSICGQAFRTQRLLDGHCMINHTGMCSDEVELNICSGSEENEPLPSQLYSYTTPLKSEMRMHMSTQSNGDTTFDCTACVKTFTIQDYVTLDSTIQSAMKLCLDCGLRAANDRSLTYPNDREVKPLKCSTCGENFKSKFLLNGHRMINHGEEKPFFECSTCGQGFDSKTFLWEHGLSHSKGEPRGTSSISIDVEPENCPDDMKPGMWSDDVKLVMCPDDVEPEMWSDEVKLLMCSNDVELVMCSDDVEPEPEMCSDDLEPDTILGL